MDGATGVRYEYVTREIGVPVCTLTAEDCEAHWRKLVQKLPLSGRRIDIKVPPLPDDASVFTLQVPLPDGQKLEVPLPEGCKEGDGLRLLQRSDESWKVMRKRERFSFVVPDCSAGDVLLLSIMDTTLSFRVPENVEPYNVVTLKDEGDWAFETCAVLPPYVERPFQADWTTGPYQQILEALRARQLLAFPERHLRVSVPFCGHFHEHVALGDFLASLRAEKAFETLEIVAMELADYTRDWAVAQRWLRRCHGIQAVVELMDLAEDPVPVAELVIGIHPEVTKGGPWFRIVGSLLKSCRRLCVFATFYEEERQTLLNMIDMYREEEDRVDSFENPFYGSLEVGLHPAMRFVVTLERGGAS